MINSQLILIMFSIKKYERYLKVYKERQLKESLSQNYIFSSLKNKNKKLELILCSNLYCKSAQRSLYNSPTNKDNFFITNIKSFNKLPSISRKSLFNSSSHEQLLKQRESYNNIKLKVIDNLKVNNKDNNIYSFSYKNIHKLKYK